MICAYCNESIDNPEDRADIINTDVHRECAMRSVLGGIGHHIDHAHFCMRLHDPDAGLDYRTSAMLVYVLVNRTGLTDEGRKMH